MTRVELSIAAEIPRVPPTSSFVTDLLNRLLMTVFNTPPPNAIGMRIISNTTTEGVTAQRNRDIARTTVEVNTSDFSS
jgi:hypothetical protein